VNRQLANIDAELATMPDEAVVPEEIMPQLTRRRRVLARLPALHERWCELAAERSDDQIGFEIRESLVKGANLICATTRGIVGRGSDVVTPRPTTTRLSSMRRAVSPKPSSSSVQSEPERWVLVGDEHQLPPHVEVADETLPPRTDGACTERTGAPRTDRNRGEGSVRLWSQDEELHSVP